MNEIETLKKEVEELKKWKESLEFSYSFPMNLDEALQARGFLKAGSNLITVPYGGTGATTLTGVLYGNGQNAVSTIAGLAGVNTIYVATSSGGAVTHAVTLTQGVVTAVV